MSTSDASANGPTEEPVVEIDGRPRLAGSACRSCDTHAFPPQSSCARCGHAMVPSALPTRGQVWSWTVQRIRPKRLKAAEPFEPFAVGYVDLGLLKVATRLAGRAPADWRIGDAVVLATASDRTGDAPLYWFEPEAPS